MTTDEVLAEALSLLAEHDRNTARSERIAHQATIGLGEAESRARGEAEQVRTQAEKAQFEATEQTERADHEAQVAQQDLYYAQMNLARQSWRERTGLAERHERVCGRSHSIPRRRHALVVDIELNVEHGCIRKSMCLENAANGFQVTRLTEASFIVSTPKRASSPER